MQTRPSNARLSSAVQTCCSPTELGLAGACALTLAFCAPSAELDATLLPVYTSEEGDTAAAGEVTFLPGLVEVIWRGRFMAAPTNRARKRCIDVENA